MAHLHPSLPHSMAEIPVHAFITYKALHNIATCYLSDLLHCHPSPTRRLWSADSNLPTLLHKNQTLNLEGTEPMQLLPQPSGTPYFNASSTQINISLSNPSSKPTCSNLHSHNSSRITFSMFLLFIFAPLFSSCHQCLWVLWKVQYKSSVLLASLHKSSI